MGHQQLLWVVLGMVIVGIAISVAISMFQSNAIESSRNALVEDLLYYANKAREYYWKPNYLGGGNKSFSTITLSALSNNSENPNGRYYIESQSDDEVVLIGVGKVVSGDDTIRVRIRVNEHNNVVQIIN